jgi:hypothetical protein
MVILVSVILAAVGLAVYFLTAHKTIGIVTFGVGLAATMWHYLGRTVG